MDTDLQIIIEFLARCGTEVQGHATVEPSTGEASLLLRFAKGQCTPQERAEACELISLHRDWLQWISARVKALRFDPPMGEMRDATSHSKS